ncbi:HAMP domain-containing histidine kinase, partial [Candidatus Dependentiae bacterium]|nr:HAMP domain-containing histidine kinase [Candidatus Dependentiae bacterium]
MNKIFFNFYRIIKSIFSRKKEIPNIDNIQDYLTLEKEKVVIGVMIIFLLDNLYLAFGREGIPLYMVISCTAAFIICLISIIYIFLDKYYTGQLIMNYGSVILWFIHFMYMLISGQSDYRFPVATTYLFTIIMMYAIVSNYIFLDKKHGLISGFIAILFMIISMFIIGKKKYFDNMISPFVFIIVLTIIIWYFINIFNTIFKKLIELKDNLQIEVKKRTAELERLSKLKNYFLANVNHEMRTPLNSIIGYSNIIDSNEISDENKKYLSNIRKSSASLLRIIDDILDITKIEAGQIDIENKVFNLKDEIENIKFNFSEKLKSKLKDINFKVNVNSEVPEFIETDPVRLNQIINNLLVNSFKYTEKGEISLTAIFEYDNENRDSGTLIIEISDTGIGIHESEAERIFEKFERLKMKEDYYNIDKSAGLGLAIVKQIAEKINGEIRLTSALNKGSKFTVEIKKIKVHQSLNECYSVGN